jgi:ParB/RepB/Spo0J family partition protein
MATVKRTDILMVPFSKLAVLDGFNDRQDYGDVEALAESLYNQGPKVPLQGYKEGDKYVVTVGHRRHRAAELVKKKYNKDIVFKFLPYPRGTSKRDMLLDTLLTNDGKELNPLEKSAVVQKLANDPDLKMTAKDIAGAIGGVSTVYVNNLLKLAAVPDKVKKHIQAGNVSSTLVIGYLKNKDADMDELAKAIEANLQPEDGLFAGTKRKGSKKKVAKVTKKNLTKKAAPKKKAAEEDSEGKSSSMVEFKRFRKQHNDIFQNKAKQEAFEFVCDIVDNKLTYTDILTFFTGK